MIWARVKRQKFQGKKLSPIPIYGTEVIGLCVCPFVLTKMLYIVRWSWVGGWGGGSCISFRYAFLTIKNALLLNFWIGPWSIFDFLVLFIRVQIFVAWTQVHIEILEHFKCFYQFRSSMRETSRFRRKSEKANSEMLCSRHIRFDQRLWTRVN